MKKFLLSMAALATMGAMTANETVVLDFTKLSELTTSSEVVAPTEKSTGTECTDVTFTKGGVSVVTTNGTNNAPVIWLTTAEATQYRIYKGSTMTVSAGENISKIVINGGNTNFTPANVTVTPGSFTASSKVATWTGSATSVAFTVGDKANMQINSIEVTLGEGGDTPEPIEPDDAIYKALGEDETELTAGWTIDNVTLPEGLDYIWNWKGYKEKYYLNGSAYKEKAFEAQATVYSPVISLAGNTGCTLSFEHAAKFQTTLRTMCGVLVREHGATSWQPLTIPTWPEAGSWTFANSGDIDLSAFDGKDIEIAFNYGSSDSGADTWEIRNLVVKGTAGINNITVDENAPVVYYNLQGVQVANPENGIYIRRQGNKATKVLVK